MSCQQRSMRAFGPARLIPLPRKSYRPCASSSAGTLSRHRHEASRPSLPNGLSLRSTIRHERKSKRVQHLHAGWRTHLLFKTVMTTHVLAGDIGGTKTNLALYVLEGEDELRLVRESSFPSAQYAGLEDVIADFLAGEVSPEPPLRSSEVDAVIAAGAFGIAGPVLDGRGRGDKSALES